MDWGQLVETVERIHDDEPQRAVELLEANLGLVTNTGEAERFTSLVNHILGGIKKEWARAAVLNRRAVERLAGASDARAALENLSTSHFMAGHLADGLATELEAVRSSGDDALPCAVAIRLRVAFFLLAGGERMSSVGLFAAATRVARSFDRPTSCDRSIATSANNAASSLLELGDRTHPEDEALEQASLTARDFWQKCGTWVNHERADYLLALTYNALRRYDVSYEAAHRGLATIAANGEQDVDRAFLLVELAMASRHLGRLEEANENARLARELGAKLEGPSLQKWFAEVSAKLG